MNKYARIEHSKPHIMPSPKPELLIEWKVMPPMLFFVSYFSKSSFILNSYLRERLKGSVSVIFTNNLCYQRKLSFYKYNLVYLDYFVTAFVWRAYNNRFIFTKFFENIYAKFSDNRKWFYLWIVLFTNCFISEVVIWRTFCLVVW